MEEYLRKQARQNAETTAMGEAQADRTAAASVVDATATGQTQQEDENNPLRIQAGGMDQPQQPAGVLPLLQQVSVTPHQNPQKFRSLLKGM